jgi:hypothetical protein
VRLLLALLLPLLPALAQDDDEFPPGPLKDLMDGLKRGDKEIRIDLYQSQLDGIEHWLVKDRARGVRELEEFVAELRPEVQGENPGLGATTAFTDAITLARRHKVRPIKDSYLMGAPAKGHGALAFELPRSARWSYRPGEGGRGAIYHHDRKGELVHTISFQTFHKRSSYTYEGKTFDGSKVALMAKAGTVAVAKQLARIRKRSPVRKTRLNKNIRVTSSFRIEGFDAKGAYVCTRAFFFRSSKDKEVTLSVSVRDLVEGKRPDPEAEAVLATLRQKK